MVKTKNNEFTDISKSRKVDKQTQLLLFAKTAGRCEICNTLLIKDDLTSRIMIWGEKAHIRAFNPGGARTDLNNLYCNTLNNLMLLCPSCHSKVDKKLQEKEYTIELLQKFKSEHEKKVLLAISAPTINKTKVLKMIANIDGQLVKISMGQIAGALMNEKMYSLEEEPEEIDLTNGVNEDSKAYWNAKKQEIKNICQKFNSDLQRSSVDSVSVFAMGPMPLLMYLGSQLNSTVNTKFFQLHKDAENWKWKKVKSIASFNFKQRRRKNNNNVALLLSLSSSIKEKELPPEVLEDYNIYELSVEPEPNCNFLKTENDLLNFQRQYKTLIGKIENKHKDLKEINMFLSVPAPIAVICGRVLNRNSGIKFKVYNKFGENKFKHILTIN